MPLEIIGFIPTQSPEAVQREKEKARALRKTQWWQRRIGEGVCHYCRRSVPPKELTMDHIVPLIRGGRSTRGNVAPACKECNTRKKYLLPVEWEEYLRELQGRVGECRGDSKYQQPEGKQDERV